MTERYRLDAPADRARTLDIAQAWRPFRGWVVVLLHVWARAQGNLPPRDRR